MQHDPRAPTRPARSQALHRARVTFAAYVNDETVEVKAKIVENCIDWDAAEVWWRDVDVLPVLHYKTLMILEQHFDENRDTIIQFDQE